MSSLTADREIGQYAQRTAKRATLAESLAALNVVVLPEDQVAAYMRQELAGRSVLLQCLTLISGYLSLGRPTLWLINRFNDAGSFIFLSIAWPVSVFVCGIQALKMLNGDNELGYVALAAAADGAVFLALIIGELCIKSFAWRADCWRRRPISGSQVIINSATSIEVPTRLATRMTAAHMIPGVRLEAYVIDEDPILLAVRGRLWWTEITPIGAWDTHDESLNKM